MTAQVFDPGDPACWLARGRSTEHAAAISRAWRTYPDLDPTAPLDLRMKRSRARVAAMRSIHETMRLETERNRVAANFAFIEAQLAAGRADPRFPLILRARDVHALGWDEAVAFADGHYAATAGWEPRSHAFEGAPAAAAYDFGFRAGGGCPDDLFDTARRAFSAVASQPAAQGAGSSAPPRPLPSCWSAPTDAPRPVRWTRRLLIMDMVHADMFAAELDRQGLSDRPVILLMDSDHGFCSPDAPDDWCPNPTRWTQSRDFEDMLIAVEEQCLAFLDAVASSIPLCRTMERVRNSAIQRRSQFRLWLGRGLAQGEVRASGHIRWGKVTQGLYGRLGEFTARYTGPHLPRGHRIIVEVAPGLAATGYRSPAGRTLEPELIISNRARLRVEMTTLLRQFAAALRYP
jgi:hypothetical protein